MFWKKVTSRVFKKTTETNFENNNEKNYDDFKKLYHQLPIKTASDSLEFIDK